jgi:hypothetical protein
MCGINKDGLVGVEAKIVAQAQGKITEGVECFLPDLSASLHGPGVLELSVDNLWVWLAELREREKRTVKHPQ